MRVLHAHANVPEMTLNPAEVLYDEGFEDNFIGT